MFRYEGNTLVDARPENAVSINLRDAAANNNWMMDWHKVDGFQRQGNQALKEKNAKQAIRFQAEAIIETIPARPNETTR